MVMYLLPNIFTLSSQKNNQIYTKIDQTKTFYHNPQRIVASEDFKFNHIVLMSHLAALNLGLHFISLFRIRHSFVKD